MFNKNEGNNQKVENKVSGRGRGRCREGFIVPITPSVIPQFR